MLLSIRKMTTMCTHIFSKALLQVMLFVIDYVT